MKHRAVLIALLCPLLAYAQAPVEYSVSFPNAVHHEAQITVVWRDIGTEPLQMRMSRSSPGRYAIHEFGKNVYSLQLADGAGKPLTFARSSPEQWDVAGHDGTVVATYTLYADRVDGTYAAIDLTHAHLNMPATFMWARGFDARPIRVTFRPADPAWKVATQLVPTEDAYVFEAPDLQYFMDSPVELSAFSERSWQLESGGRTQTFRLVVHHQGNEADVDALLAKARTVVAVQTAVFGELPAFDYGVYTFIADYLPYAVGDGMEHRNSTILTEGNALINMDVGYHLEALSHELFHAWNAERIRPDELEPFDFERANMTSSLWFLEGFTSYYGPLAIRRAGHKTLDAFAGGIADLINTVTFAPGRGFDSPEGMSLQAPFVDAAVANDPNNRANVYISYYNYGAALGLALDLTLRERFDGVTLDTLMRRMWEIHGKTQDPYTPVDLRAALADVTQDADFANDFFARYIAGRELPDYASLLANAGLILRKARAGAPSLGRATLAFKGQTAALATATLIGTPLYEAGLEQGDEVLAIDRYTIQNQQQWDDTLTRYAPGDKATIHYRQRGIDRTAAIVFAEDPRLEVVTFEAAEREPNAAQRAFRTAWLGVE